MNSLAIARSVLRSRRFASTISTGSIATAVAATPIAIPTPSLTILPTIDIADPPVMEKSTTAPVIVTQPDAKSRVRGAHWANADATAFINPWDSANGTTINPLNGFKFSYQKFRAPNPDIKTPEKFITIREPTFPSGPSSNFRSTWLGHACVLATFPSESGEGITVLFDPVFSKRCGPTSYLGPERFTPSPCQVADLPHIDVVVISHNHYDHQDIPTLRDLFAKQADRQPLLFLPLNTIQSLTPGRLPLDRIVEMDWWEESTVEVPGKGRVQLTCTPSQHGSGRGVFDQGKALWASWAVKSGDANIWFAGDTGYCAVHDDHSHSIDPSLPINPSFKEIGTRLGPFTGTFIPIGAYAPRSMLSVVHNAPIDAVRMFRDVQARQGYAIHWGAWDLSVESVSEPPRLLEVARKEVGLSEEEFGIVDVGEMTEWEV